MKEGLSIEKKIDELNGREISLQRRIIGLKDQEIRGINEAFNRMKDIADHALKLSETGEKSVIQEITEWVIQIAIGVGVYIWAK